MDANLTGSRMGEAPAAAPASAAADHFAQFVADIQQRIESQRHHFSETIRSVAQWKVQVSEAQDVEFQLRSLHRIRVTLNFCSDNHSTVETVETIPELSGHWHILCSAPTEGRFCLTIELCTVNPLSSQLSYGGQLNRRQSREGVYVELTLNTDGQVEFTGSVDVADWRAEQEALALATPPEQAHTVKRINFQHTELSQQVRVQAGANVRNSTPQSLTHLPTHPLTHPRTHVVVDCACC